MSDEQKKQSLLKRLGLACLQSPINTLFILAILGQCFYIFALGNDDVYYKMILLGIVLLWILWTIAKYVLTMLLIIALLCVGGYLYYDYTQKDVIKCEESGGQWNKTTKKCEDRAPTFSEQLEKKWDEFKKQAIEKLL